MKTPRDLTGPDLARALRWLGYEITRQTGSHLRITTQERGEHHEVIPHHHPLKIGALKSILCNVAAHHQKHRAGPAAEAGPPACISHHFSDCEAEVPKRSQNAG